MVRKFVVFMSLALSIVSCCYVGKRTMYGLPRKNISPFKGGYSSNEYIDTTALYKRTIYFQYSKSLKGFSYYGRVDDNSYPDISYFKFYSNGKIGLFIIPKKDTVSLTKDVFNPLKAKMGYYSFANNVIKTRIATIGDCSLFISNKKGYIRNDTLMLENRQHHGSIYIKKVVPVELIKDWSPDW